MGAVATNKEVAKYFGVRYVSLIFHGHLEPKHDIVGVLNKFKLIFNAGK